MSSPTTRRPNVLILMTDQQRFDLAGFAGNDVVRTPYLDELAKDAVVFNNAYTPSPICVPARQAILAGQLPTTCNCTKFSDDLEPGYMTYPRRFSEYAYNTVVCGKLHLTGPDQQQGWLCRIGQDNGISPSFIANKNEEAYQNLPSKGDQWWDWSKEIRRAGIGKSTHQVIDEYAVNGALNFIDEWFNSPYYDKESPDHPLMLKVSLRLPHYPYLTDEKRFNYYLNRVKPFTNEDRLDHPYHPRDWEEVSDDVSEREMRRATAAYYGMMEATDEQFGRVIDRLRYVGQDLDDWIIVFSTDHGDLLGEHGMWMKTKYLDGSAKVPLFIRYPRDYTSREVEENVNLCDLFATLCDMADVPAPDGLDSRTLTGLMQGDASNWDNETISQLDDTCMIKRDHLKYQYFGPDMPELLFDLESDPGETTDCMNDPAYQDEIAQFRERLNAIEG